MAVALIAVMTMRAFGIGPAASLLNAGRIDENSRVIVAQFQATTSDTSLGTVVAQAMRTSLGQSNAVRLVSAAEVADGLQRMKLPEDATLDDKVARDLAIRNGVPLVVTGRVASAAAGFMVSASLVRADSGTVLVTLQEGANGAADLLGAVDEVARGMRARIGESLRTLARTPPLEQVTTRSLDALREYSRALELGDGRGDFVAGREHVRAALAADSTFAQAWRKLSVYDVNLGAPLSDILYSTTQAYRYRDRLTDFERTEVEAYYLLTFHSALADEYYATHPELSQNNRVIVLNDFGRYAEADSVMSAEMAATEARGEKPIVQVLSNLRDAQAYAGNLEGLRTTTSRLVQDFPGTAPALYSEAVSALYVSLDSGEAVTLRNSRNGPPLGVVRLTTMLAGFAMARGQAGRGAALARRALALQDSLRIDYNPFGNTAAMLTSLTALRGNVSAGVQSLDSLAARMPKDVPAVDAADLELAQGYALMGRPDKAAVHLARFERETTAEEKYARWSVWQAARGEVALAEGRTDDAIAAFRRSAMSDSGYVESAWNGRTDLRLARAFDKAGNADSAIAHFEALRRPGMRAGILYFQPVALAIAPRRLGELYEDRGDRAKAVESYEAFVELWKNADAELQPQVADVRARIARLRAAEARQR